MWTVRLDLIPCAEIRSNVDPLRIRLPLVRELKLIGPRFFYENRIKNTNNKHNEKHNH